MQNMRCPDHPDVIYDPREENCRECDEDKIQAVLDALDEMTMGMVPVE